MAAEEGMLLCCGFLEPDIYHSSSPPPSINCHVQNHHHQFSSYLQSPHPYDYFTSSGSSQSHLYQTPHLLLDDLMDENNMGPAEADIFASMPPADVVGLCCWSRKNNNRAAADPNAVPVVHCHDLKLRSSSNWDGDGAAANYSSMVDVDVEDEVVFARSCLAVLLDDNPPPQPRPPANNYNASAASHHGSKPMLVAPPPPSPSSSHHTTTTTTTAVVHGVLMSSASGEIGHGRDWCFCPALPKPEKSVVSCDVGRSGSSSETALGTISSTKSESVRRRQISRLFSSLRALFPPVLIPQQQQFQQLNDKCKLIDYTCQYIRELENKLLKLKRKIKILKRMNSSKLHRLQHQSQSSSLDQVQIAHMQVASSCGGKVVNISLGCYGTTLSFSTLLRILDMRGLDVLSANCSLSCNTTLYAIHSKVKVSTSSFSSMDIENLQAELKFKTR